ncbi:hypothetical protein XENTR_v10021907 [Xenopus tropicalis]|uniref:DDB1- and CUL4-associated factor 4 isoform X2 n=1 Tax=Xenopus tropicalis TaxID=8364 RepID=A0A8J0R6R2_XENTR|nr:DDB1- and CUL4-associated factor 4 isoform X2 [Xenopus tropicalis]KAE8587248.1 hypothetical protein XENTR_v10021907 [Xenopus tropicalis]KAE8587249.1 hypothetical protein XENTR_v10021907 [Xenopus tropicalis]|eukprot:XP_004917302.1 PREDICTED: DDB1- and CUL4-associated factor 4 isoform X2 [Xenopus tropicalis]
MGPKRENKRNWNRKYQGQRFPQRSPSEASQSSTSIQSNKMDRTSSSSSSQASAAPELPGFYFDPEKNRYFRMLPGHNNCNPLTREGIQQKEMECKRLQLLEEEKNRKKSGPGLNSALLLRKRQLGLVPFTTYCRRIHEMKVSCMQRKVVHINSPEREGGRARRFEFIMADSAYERLFAVNDGDYGFCKYGLLNLDGLWKEAPTVERQDHTYISHQKVIAACWASVTGPDSHILVCLLEGEETRGCLSLIPACIFRNLDDSEDDCSAILYKVKISDVWSCAWCSNPQMESSYSAGLKRQIWLINVIPDIRSTFITNSDVLAQQFATKTLLLYNGLRSGEVFSLDFRVPTTCPAYFRKATSFTQNSAITSLRLLQDENYLMVADMSGQIKLWDVRMQKSVKHYKGHNNSYAILPLHVKEDEGLLMAVGQDCYTRIWDLADTRLLRTIPSPHPAAKDSIPSVVFSPYLGVKGHKIPGLLMAVNRDMYLYSYNPSHL